MGEIAQKGGIKEPLSKQQCSVCGYEWWIKKKDQEKVICCCFCTVNFGRRIVVGDVPDNLRN